MYLPHMSRFSKRIRTIQPGEYHVSCEDEMIGTMLGSCVAVCLHDPVKKVSGMNHFMLPGRIVKADLFQDQSARYGINAINELLAMMERLGADRTRIIAKIFGGGNVVPSMTKTNTIPADNVRLARVMLELEDIPIEEMVVGGTYARKIVMDVKTGRVFMKSITKNDVLRKLYEKENDYFVQGTAAR